MTIDRLLHELSDAAERLGAPVRKERGAFRGGLCTVEGEQVVVLNKKHPPEAQVAILARSLRQLGTEGIFLKPVVRAELERIWADEDARRGTAPAPLADADAA